MVILAFTSWFIPRPPERRLPPESANYGLCVVQERKNVTGETSFGRCGLSVHQRVYWTSPLPDLSLYTNRRRRCSQPVNALLLRVVVSCEIIGAAVERTLKRKFSCEWRYASYNMAITPDGKAT